jgi:two-component system sensor histidine kinase KdpD
VTNLVAIGLESAHNQEIAGRAELARRSEEFKSTLLDTLAHELKTPLTAIKAAVTAVLDKKAGISSDDRELLTVIDEESDRLSRLISESIQMARTEAGKLRLNLRPQNVRKLVESALESLRTEMEGREVRIEGGHSLPPVLADAELMDVVLRQLLDNAAKYSTVGTPITISAQFDGDHVQIGVKDEGPGISEHEQDKVFEKFYRRPDTPDGVPGLGIGLAIARDMIVAQAGRMWVESVPGQGSRFLFTLPVATERTTP